MSELTVILWLMLAFVLLFAGGKLLWGAFA